MATIVLGSQWGDEGKGKLIDVLLHGERTFKLCARAAGGDNAGHTIEHGGIKYDFHILPSGLLSQNTLNLIGTGCVIHIPGFFKELESLRSKGLPDITPERLKVSSRAHVVFKLHQVIDSLEEAALGTGSIGTTKRGIGPTYANKSARTGIRLSEIFNVDETARRLRDLAEKAGRLYGVDRLREAGYDVEEEIRSLGGKTGWTERLRPFKVDQVPLIRDLQLREESILVEGANALMLDINNGTYPYVTSSDTTIGGVFAGLGLSPHNKKYEVVGVVKAYTTRVGSGPFPTEETGAFGQLLQKEGREFGATTGRPRRCGALDLPLLRYSASVNDYTVLNLTKLDVLDSLSSIPICTSYKLDGRTLKSFPDNVEDLLRVECVYEDVKGWGSTGKTVRGTKEFAGLPEEAVGLVEMVEREIGVRVGWIGTGPERESMIVR